MLLVAKADLRRAAVQVVDAHISGLEANVTPTVQPRFDQVFVDIMLCIDRHLFATSKRWKIDAFVTAVET